MCFFAFLNTLNLVLVDAAKASSDFFIPSKMVKWPFFSSSSKVDNI